MSKINEIFQEGWFDLLKQKELAFLDSKYELDVGEIYAFGKLVLQTVDDSLISTFQAKFTCRI
jgi:hypothetical protein